MGGVWKAVYTWIFDKVQSSWHKHLLIKLTSEANRDFFKLKSWKLLILYGTCIRSNATYPQAETEATYIRRKAIISKMFFVRNFRLYGIANKKGQAVVICTLATPRVCTKNYNSLIFMHIVASVRFFPKAALLMKRLTVYVIPPLKHSSNCDTLCYFFKACALNVHWELKSVTWLFVTCSTWIRATSTLPAHVPCMSERGQTELHAPPMLTKVLGNENNNRSDGSAIGYCGCWTLCDSIDFGALTCAFNRHQPYFYKFSSNGFVIFTFYTNTARKRYGKTDTMMTER